MLRPFAKVAKISVFMFIDISLQNYNPSAQSQDVIVFLIDNSRIARKLTVKDRNNCNFNYQQLVL